MCRDFRAVCPHQLGLALAVEHVQVLDQLPVREHLVSAFRFKTWHLGHFALGVGIWGPGMGMWDVDFGVWGVWNLGFGVWDLGFRVWGLGFGVWGLGFGVRVGMFLWLCTTELGSG